MDGQPVWVEAGAARLAVWQAGVGVPVVMMHAGVADSRMWRGQFAGLAQRAQVIAFDRRGFGRTAAADGEHTRVGDLLAVLDAVAPGRPAVLVGCSQGGRIAIDTALAHPGRVAGLVLIGSAVSGRPEVAPLPAMARLEAAIAVAEQAGDLGLLNALEAQLWLDGPTAPAGRVRGAVRALFLEMNGIALAAPDIGRVVAPPSAFDRLERVAAPTLVAWGNLDCVDVIAYGEAIAARVPGARRLVFPGTAHLPSMEAPEAVLAAILAAILGRV